jgi:hypothetical protein
MFARACKGGEQRYCELLNRFAADSIKANAGKAPGAAAP